MIHVHTQIYLQFLLAVKSGESLIPSEYKGTLHKYVRALVHRRESKLIAVHCLPDHMHLFVAFKPVMCVSEFITHIKAQTNEFINYKRWTKRKFEWQEGYAVFSYSHSHIQRVVRYIVNQERHHLTRTFREEYFDFLKKYEIAFKHEGDYNSDGAYPVTSTQLNSLCL